MYEEIDRRKIIFLRFFVEFLSIAHSKCSCYVLVMPNDARIVANMILDSFDAERYDISNKKINKLLYYCHGFSLVRLNSELLRNHFEAWTHGPVVRVVYEEFRRYNHNPIKGRASFFNYETGESEIATYEKMSQQERELTLKVVAYFVRYSAEELERKTHQENSPWWIVKQMQPGDRGIRDRIPNELIRREFSTEYGDLGKTQ